MLAAGGWTVDSIREEVVKMVEAEEKAKSTTQDKGNPSCLVSSNDPEPDDPKKDGRFISGFDSAFVLKCLGRNQIGDAELFQAIHRGLLLYDHSAGQWFKWAGHFWQIDKTESYITAVQAVCKIYETELQRTSWKANGARARAEPPDKKAEGLEKALRARLTALQSKSRIMDVLMLARAGDGGLSTSGDLWDANQLLFPCLNGVLELETGHFRPGKPSDMILTHCEAEWLGKDEPCPNFERFISEIFDGVKNIVKFMQRIMGYCLTGLSVERVLIILYGARGQNGKGTLLELMKKILGKLAAEIPVETLLASGKEASGAAPRPDVLLMRGKRIVWCSETNKQKPLDVARCKLISGGDTQVARNLHSNFVEFEQTAKVFMLSNHKPKADGTDDALWLRLLLIPFVLSFVANPKQEHERQRDEFIQAKLVKEASGILAWLYKGYLEWRRIGLSPPEEVLMATQDFRNENDSISQFIDDCCLVSPGIRAKPTELYQAFQKFCADEGGIEPENQLSFFSYLKTRFKREKTKRGRWYLGICLKTESEG